MFRTSFNTFLFLVIVIFAGYAGVLAQTAPVSGTVQLKKADGTVEPVAGALIEVYRIDIKNGFPSAKTSKNGEFNFAGLPYSGTFAFAISAPNCRPKIWGNVKAGQDKLVIQLEPGDGSKLLESDVRKGVTEKDPTGTTTAATAEATADQKKAQADYEAKKKDVEDKNNKVTKTNEITSRAIKEGSDAFAAKNYDLAIAKYDEGIAADPDFVGSAPVFHKNRGIVLMARAVDSYNKVIKSTDPTEKLAGFNSARKDLADASAGYLRSWTILKNAPSADITDQNSFQAIKMDTLRGARDVFKMAVRTEQVDPAMIEAAKLLIPEYIAVESDPVKKAEANLIFADLYRVAADSPNAIAAYKKILETSPDDVDALAGAGLSLVNLGFINNDKAMLQEGVNYLQKFASIAPDTHKYKPDAVALIETLKKEQNVTPQKTPAKKKP